MRQIHESADASSHRKFDSVQTTKELTAPQQRLLRIMHECQFGRVENLKVRSGQPDFDGGTKVVRVTRLGTERDPSRRPAGEFELKEAIRNLFAQLALLQNGVVERLEFRHGLPCLLETAGPLENPET